MNIKREELATEIKELKKDLAEGFKDEKEYLENLIEEKTNELKSLRPSAQKKSNEPKPKMIKVRKNAYREHGRILYKGTGLTFIESDWCDQVEKDLKSDKSTLYKISDNHYILYHEGEELEMKW